MCLIEVLTGMRRSPASNLPDNAATVVPRTAAIKIYSLTEEGGIASLDSPGLAPEWFTDNIVRWIDLTASDTAEIERLLEPLELHGKVRAAAAATEARPHVIAFEKLLFVRIPYLGRDGEHHFLSLICGPTAIVSARTSPLVEIDELVGTLETGDRTLRPSVGDLLIQILEAVFREGEPIALKLRDRINQLSDMLQADAGQVSAGDVMALKSRSSALAGLFEDQLICLGNLMAVRSGFLNLPEVKRDLQVLIQVIEQVRPIALRLDDQARELRLGYAGLLQEASNRRLNVLAVLSAIYLPSTLIAGVFGMNFDDIPATQISGGYWIVLVLMVALVVGQLVFFWRKGWFR